MASIDLIRASNGSGDAVKATVTNARVISSTTLQVSAITNFPSKFIATVGSVDGTGAFVPASVTVFLGHTSGGNIEIDSFAPGYTDIGNTPGQIVVLKPTTAWANEIGSVLDAVHNDNGTLKSNSVDTAQIKDNAITTAKINDGAVTFSKLGIDVGGYKVLADVTASGTVTSISSGTISAMSYIKIIVIAIPIGGTLNVGIRFNNDSGTNYAERGSVNGAADAAGGSLNQVNTKVAIDANLQLTKGDFINISNQEKLGIMETVSGGTVGAVNVPERKEGTYKWSNTSTQITRVDVLDTGGTGDIAAGSRLIVMGRN